ncbi:MAG: competence type IV pilus minor pilin ComGD [Longicatena sp.]
MYNKGFSLLEMLLVLSVISILLFVFPLIAPNKGILLRYEMETIRQKLMASQDHAMLTKQNITIAFNGNVLSIQKHDYDLKYNVECHGNPFLFNEMGNVSRAQSVQCSLQNKEAKLIVQLGSGRMYVK